MMFLILFSSSDCLCYAFSCKKRKKSSAFSEVFLCPAFYPNLRFTSIRTCIYAYMAAYTSICREYIHTCPICICVHLALSMLILEIGGNSQESMDGSCMSSNSAGNVIVRMRSRQAIGSASFWLEMIRGCRSAIIIPPHNPAHACSRKNPAIIPIHIG